MPRGRGKGATLSLCDALLGGALRTVTVTRYVTPLREGGSLPAIVEADDDGMYVLKFRGAGQGAKALIAELIGGEIARAAGLAVPEIVFAELSPDLARTEPDPEIQALIRASGGLNLGLDYLPGSVTFDPLAEEIESEIASAIVWLDAYLSNVDRTARNTNLLVWHRRVWLIDHGAALYFHHGASDFSQRSGEPFARIGEHVLLPYARSLEEVDVRLTERLDAETIERIVSLIPESWLESSEGRSAAAQRRAYAKYLSRRLESPRRFLEEAVRARSVDV